MSGLLIFTGIIIRIFVGIDLVDAPNEAVWLIIPAGLLVLTLAVGQRLVKLKLKGKGEIADK
jgi:UDP-N-acetylmuramyl pentapeptide phosphotransferase/UDP-N-acetylglucosamine-1-phosphate transferase